MGLTEIKGLDIQVDEVIRSIDVFLGYGTFREELGGRRGEASCSRDRPGPARRTSQRRWRSRPACRSCSSRRRRSCRCAKACPPTGSVRSSRQLRKAARKEGARSASSRRSTRWRWLEGSRAVRRARSRWLGASASSWVGGEREHGQRAADPDAVVRPATARTRMQGKIIAWLNGYLPTNWQFSRCSAPSTTTSC